MTNNKKTLVSGIKPTGRVHIGNYFGAIKQFASLQDEYNSYVFIADLHALTTIQNQKKLSENSINLAIDYLALGLDPKKTTIFRQSDILEHTELTWILNCLTTVPYLMRAHAFKDAESKGREINVGIFDYPILMAADILLYNANVVPIGFDQKQHIEIVRDTALRFNRTYGDVFIVPEPLILKETGTVLGTDGRKMSKSYDNTISIFATDEEIRSGVMKIPTDSKGVNEPKDPNTCKIFGLHKFFSTTEEMSTLDTKYRNGNIGYKESKELLIANMQKFIKPFRDKRTEIASDEKRIIKTLTMGAKQAKEVSKQTMKIIRQKVGFFN